MARIVEIVTASLLMTAMAGAAGQAAEDVIAGKAVFAKCAICHSAVAGQVKIGPPLWGVVGRPSANVANYTYSEPMKNAHKIWDAPTLDVYLTNPRGLVPGTKMIFPGLKEQADRDNLVAYLATLK